MKATRSEIAEKIKVHKGTVESLINQRTKISMKTASKILNLLESCEENPEEITQIYKESENKNWPKLIRKILIEKERSQRELAEELGCSRSLVREWLSGLKPANKYKGKLLEMPKYEGEIDCDLGSIVNEALKNNTFSDLKEKLGVSTTTVRGWKNGQEVQPRHIKRITKLRDKIKS